MMTLKAFVLPESSSSYFIEWTIEAASECAGLGIIVLKSGRVEEARAQLQKALQICILKLGKDHACTAEARGCLLQCTDSR